MLDDNIEVFVVYIAFFNLKIISYLPHKVYIALLLVKKVIISSKNLSFANFFSKKSAKVLPEQTEVNENAIKLEEGKQLFYEPFYSLGVIEMKIFKTYIKANLSICFIRASNS